MARQDTMFNTLIGRGFSAALQDMMFEDLRNKGATGALQDMLQEFPGYIDSLFLTPTLEMPLISDLSLAVGELPVSFSRSTPATFIDPADGILKTAAANVARFESGGLLIEGESTNILFHSEDISDAYFTKTNTTVSANVTTAPDGTLTADKLVATAVAGNHNLSKSVQSILGGNYSVFAKAAGNDWILLSSHSTSAVATRGTFFNVATGQIGEIGTAAQNAKIIPLANGWFRCSIDEGSAPSSIYSVFSCEADGSTSYTGNGTDGTFLWGLQNDSAVPSGAAYKKTTTVSASVTTDDLFLNVDNMPSVLGDYSIMVILELSGINTSGTVFDITGETTRSLVFDADEDMTGIHGTSVVAVDAITDSLPHKVAMSVGAEISLIVDDNTVATGAKGTVTGGGTSIAIGRAAGGNYIFSSLKNLRIYPNTVTPEIVDALLS